MPAGKPHASVPNWRCELLSWPKCDHAWLIEVGLSFSGSGRLGVGFRRKPKGKPRFVGGPQKQDRPKTPVFSNATGFGQMLYPPGTSVLPRGASTRRALVDGEALWGNPQQFLGNQRTFLVDMKSCCDVQSSHCGNGRASSLIHGLSQLANLTTT